MRHVSIRLIVGARSRDDPREKAGINHFVEHLSFAARSAIPTRARFAPTSRRVASMRAMMNAHTAEESTTLEVDVSAGTCALRRAELG